MEFEAVLASPTPLPQPGVDEDASKRRFSGRWRGGIGEMGGSGVVEVKMNVCPA